MDSLSPSEKGKTRVSYFNFEFNSKMATSLVHTLNRPYKGAHKFSATAPDAQGTLVIWARDTEECREHLLNALFDLIFARNRVGAAVTNPPCIFCGGKTQSRGRNSSGTRAWRCMNPDCQRSFVIDRTFRGGINHPTQSKKPAFYQLVFVDGKTITGGVRRSRHLDERRRQLVSENVCCSEADRPQMSLRQGTAPPGGLSVSARIPDGKGNAHDENRSAVRSGRR